MFWSPLEKQVAELFHLVDYEVVETLARRPLLLKIIDSIAELEKSSGTDVSLNSLYEAYTGPWISRKHDEGCEHVLIDPAKKYEFLALLALKMHFTGSMTLHFKDLDDPIKAHFEPHKAEDIDPFSDDARTCHYLRQDVAGYFRFVHRSFVDYFVATEFTRLERSVYSGRFERPLTKTMIQFIDPDAIPEELQLLLGLKDVMEQLHARNHFTDFVEVNCDDPSLPTAGSFANQLDIHICFQWPSFGHPATRALTDRILDYMHENKEPFLGYPEDAMHQTYICEIKIDTKFARALRTAGLDQEYSDGYTRLAIGGDE